MKNGDNNDVTVKLREKAEKILLSKYDRAVAKFKKEHAEATTELKKQIISEWGLDKIVQEILKLKNTQDGLEEQVKGKLGFTHGYHELSQWERGIFQGDKLGKEVALRGKSDIDIEKEELRLRELKDELLERLWLCGQSKEVRDVLSKMI
ncbi:MAG: hypothetical protein WC614_13460 [bacterium]